MKTKTGPLAYLKDFTNMAENVLLLGGRQPALNGALTISDGKPLLLVETWGAGQKRRDLRMRGELRRCARRRRRRRLQRTQLNSSA